MTRVADPSSIERLRLIMTRLRDPDHGCPWDREQTFATIAPFTIEEAYEVAAAIDSGKPDELRDELGDLLFQVVFHARLAEERDWFDFDAVAAAICAKLERRHPHVFGDQVVHSAQAQAQAWDDHKARERSAASIVEDTSELAGVPLALPALARAHKLGKRAARVQFDWPDPSGVRAKIDEELREVETAVSANEQREEIGDLLFAVANWARHLGVDAEEALRLANAKFERRFRQMETLAKQRSIPLHELQPDDWEALWSLAKRTP